MAEIKETMKLGYYFMNLEDKYWGLFLIAMVAVFFLLNKKKGFLLSYGILSYCFLLCPVTVFLMVKGLPALEAYYPIRWLCQIPLFLCLAMTLVLQKAKKELDMKYTLGGAAMLFLMLFLAGTPVFLTKTPVSAHASGLNGEYVEVYDMILQDMEKRGLEKAYIWGPKDWMKDSRVYNGAFYPVYGKDIWDSQAAEGFESSYSEGCRTLYEFYTYYEDINGTLDNKWQQVEVLADAPDTQNVTCDYVVMHRGTNRWKERGSKVEKLDNVDVEGTFLSRNYEEVGKTENYFLFYRQAGE